MTPLNIIATSNIFMTTSTSNASSASNSTNLPVFHSQMISNMIAPLHIHQDRLVESSCNFSTGFTPTPTPGNCMISAHPNFNPLQNPLSIRVNQSSESFEQLSAISGGGRSSSSNQSPKVTPHQSRTSSSQGLNQPAIMDEQWEEPEHGNYTFVVFLYSYNL